MRRPGSGSNALVPEAGERLRWLRRRLLFWFARHGRSFPWRETGRTPYEVVVAEILLQRTTAAAVARVYPRFTALFPSWTSLSQAPLERLAGALRLVRGRRSLEVNWAVLDFGALVCRPRHPLCRECPLRTRCAYARTRSPLSTPSAGAP